MTPEELRCLKEGWSFEAKLAQGRDGRVELPSSFWESYSAFANTNGGIILLGAAERSDGSLEINGLTDPDKVERELWNGLQNPQKTSVNLLNADHVSRTIVEGRTVLVIRVPKASRTERPVHINGSLERAWVRIHEGDRLMRPDIVKRMVADSIPDRDAGLLDGYDASDLNDESVSRYRQMFASKRPDHPFVAATDTDFLLQIGALKKRRDQSSIGLSLAGLLVLGKELSIRERFPHWHLSYRELPGATAEESRWTDRIHADGSWNANLFEFYRRIILKLFEIRLSNRIRGWNTNSSN